MTADERRRAFAEAFVAQSRSDWAAYRVLARQKEIAKAYRLRDTNAPVDELLSKHTGFAKFIGPFFVAALKQEYAGKDAQLMRLLTRARTLAREIEKLAPAIDRATTPENAEYPWERDDRVIAPCRYAFPSLELLRQPGGRAFLNLIERALDGFDG